MTQMTIEPRQPEHADKVTTPPGVERRIQIRRRLTGYPYGRQHPAYATPEYAWDLLVDGRFVQEFRLRRLAVAVAKDSQADDLLAGL